MKKLLVIALLPLLVGCGTKQYYEQQPNRDQAEANRVTQVALGYQSIAQAVFAPPAQQGAQRPVQQPHVYQEKQVPQMRYNPHQPPCNACGGGEESDDSQPTEAVVHLGYDATGQVIPERIEFKDAVSDQKEVCPQDDPCFENMPVNDHGQAPVEGTGEATHLESEKDFYRNMEPGPRSGATRSNKAGVNHEAGGGGQESLLLQYIFAEKQAAAEQAAAEEKTKQVQAIVAGYTQAILKPMQQQDAPFDPTQLGLEFVRQTPLGLATWGLLSMGKAGIAGARGNTTAEINNGSSLAQEGATADGLYSAPSTTVITPIAGEAEAE